MHRPWTICVALLAIAGCDNTTDASAGTEGGGIDQPRGGYQVAQRCNGLGPASLDLTATDKSNNYRLLVRGGEQEPRYAAVDDLVVGPSWSDDYSTIETAADGLPLYEWRAQLTKEPGWLDDDGTGKKALPDDAEIAYDADEDQFFFESGCGEEKRAANHAYRHTESRLVLRSLNLAMAEARERLYQQADHDYIEHRGEYLGRSGADGVSEGHHDRNQLLLNVAALMKADAADDVPGLARLVAEHRPADDAEARRYRQELPAYLGAAARAHARWYIDAADIRLDWFHGTYPEGEAAIREGMANLQDAYLRLAGE